MTGSKEKLDAIAAALTAAGYDPYAQMYGYLKTGDETCITRRDGARDLIKKVSKDELAAYVEQLASGVE